MRYSQVPKFARDSNRPSWRYARRKLSWTTSSASCSLPVILNASRKTLRLCRSTSVRKASLSPWRARARTAPISVASTIHKLRRTLSAAVSGGCRWGWWAGRAGRAGVGQRGRWGRWGRAGGRPPALPALFHPRLDRRQRGEHDIADGLKASGTDGIERVPGRVPRLVVQVDDVDRGDAGLEKRHVIVVNRRFFRDERALELLAPGRIPDDGREPRRRVAIATDLQIAIRNHVDEDQGLRRCERPVLARRLDVAAAAMSVVVSLPLDDGFLAVEEEKLDRQRVAAILERAGELEEERGARSAVAGADEPELAKQLGIVVPGEDQAIFPGA